MKSQPLSHWGLNTSRLVLGCMGLGGGWNRDPITNEHLKHAESAVEAALEAGITMFDHADIYTMGKAETVFGQVLKKRPQLRDSIVIQSKCGIRFAEGDVPSRYDFSKSHILNAVDGILQRLGIETLDILLLHRPDPLMEPDEVAEAIHSLKSSGKAKRFGVSNMSAGQIRFLQQASSEPIIVNQLEMSLGHLHWLEQGILVNQHAARASTSPRACWSSAKRNASKSKRGARSPAGYSPDVRRTASRSTSGKRPRSSPGWRSRRKRRRKPSSSAG